MTLTVASLGGDLENCLTRIAGQAQFGALPTEFLLVPYVQSPDRCAGRRHSHGKGDPNAHVAVLVTARPAFGASRHASRAEVRVSGGRKAGTLYLIEGTPERDL